jgi:hypothetical protein
MPGRLKAMSLSLGLMWEGRSVDDSLRDRHGLTEVEAEGGRLFIGQAFPDSILKKNHGRRMRK